MIKLHKQYFKQYFLTTAQTTSNSTLLAEVSYDEATYASRRTAGDTLGAFENKGSCKTWGANGVYYGGFENRELRHAVPIKTIFWRLGLTSTQTEGVFQPIIAIYLPCTQTNLCIAFYCIRNWL